MSKGSGLDGTIESSTFPELCVMRGDASIRISRRVDVNVASCIHFFLQARKSSTAGIRLSGRIAQVKEETAQRAGDTEQYAQAA